MTQIPKSALMATRAVLPAPVIDCCGRERTAIEEVVMNRPGTKFWLWVGWYVQMARGPERITYRAHEISYAEAAAHAERMEGQPAA